MVDTRINAARSKFFDLTDSVWKCAVMTFKAKQVFLRETLQSLDAFKSFIPKSLLIFFLGAITGANPLYIAERNAILNSNVYYDDDVVAASTAAIPDIPMSVVHFQQVTSFFL